MLSRRDCSRRLSERAGGLIHSGRTSRVTRRKIVGTALTLLFDHLEGHNRAPGDIVVSDAIQTFDAEGVNAVRAKAPSRRQRDHARLRRALPCGVVRC
jgi:hypothetical protein